MLGALLRAGDTRARSCRAWSARICLVLGFYALSVLPVSYAGVALLVLAALLFVAEIKVTSYGLLGGGGVGLARCSAR